MSGRAGAKFWLTRAAALGLVCLVGSGCALYHNLGSGVRYDPPDEHVPSEKSKLVREIKLEVTTNAAGVVTLVQFKRSSGSPEIDRYVADSLRSGWTGGPALRTVVTLTYSAANGFSTPKLVSSVPAP
jgi:hypothetical protein